jgi:hypothetical protein
MAPQVELADGAEAEKSDDEKNTKEKRYVWKYGINDRVSGLDILPSSFHPCGTLRGDYMQVAKAIGAVPHPAFKPQKTKSSKGRSLVQQGQVKDRDNTNSGENSDQEPAAFTIQSVRLDRISALILGLILPEALHIKVIRLLDCRLDPKMLRLLRKGLADNCAVECLQIEWNPFGDEASPQHTVRSEADCGDADDAGRALSDFLDDENVLECFSLRACALKRSQIAPMAVMLAKSQPWQLRQLNLWENAICDDAAADLAVALQEYRGLEYLGLGRNRITDVGAIAVCRPLASEILNETEVEPVRAHIKDQQERYDAAAKAKAKAKPKAGSKTRQRREAPLFVDELEERPAADDSGESAQTRWVLRKHSELKILSLMENPIRNVTTLQKLQPFGPRRAEGPRAELTLLGTPAAETLLLKYPDLSSKERRSFCFPSSGHADVPGGTSDGWLLRLL